MTSQVKLSNTDISVLITAALQVKFLI